MVVPTGSKAFSTTINTCGCVMDHALLIGRPEYRPKQVVRAANTNSKLSVYSTEMSCLLFYRALTRCINNKVSASPASPQLSEASTHSATATTSTKSAIPLTKMKISVITYSALAFMTPVTHAATVYNNYRYADCQNQPYATKIVSVHSQLMRNN